MPQPSGFDVQVRSKLDGPTGDRPQEEVGRRTNQYRVPWADRQIATVVEGDTLYVANRFQVAAYNLADGQRKWQSQNPPGSMARAQDWAMIPMKPLVTGDRIFVRLLYSVEPAAGLPGKIDGQAAVDRREPRTRVSRLRSAPRAGAARRPGHPRFSRSSRGSFAGASSIRRPASC